MLNLQEWEKDYKVKQHQSELTKKTESLSVFDKNLMRKSIQSLREEYLSVVTEIEFNQKRLTWFKRLAENSDDPRLYPKIQKIRGEIASETKKHLDILDIMEKYDLYIID